MESTPFRLFPPGWKYRACLMLGAALLSACGAPVSERVEDSAVIAAEPLILDEPAPVIEAMPPETPGRTPAIRAGVLTAGDIDDTLNFAAFQRYARAARSETGLPRLQTSRPLLAQLRAPDGRPAPGVRYTLRRPGAAEPFHSGYSGVDGNITVFPELLGGRSGEAVELRAFPEDQGQAHVVRLPVGSGRNPVTLPFEGGWQPDFLDLVFVVDTTGSMADELEWLTAELRSIVRKAQSRAPGVDIRYGLVVYRDEGDLYTVRNLGFTGRQGQMIRWLRAQRADGGGDYPEAAAAALASGAGLDWRRGKGERLLFHIADAPPHSEDARAYLAAAHRAAEDGVQIFGLGASGVAAESEFLMRQAALVTEGRYLFLTDDSGVGYAHAEPTISCYRVTALSGLVARVLESELSGIRVEAQKSDVIREVGSYARGVCRD